MKRVWLGPDMRRRRLGSSVAIKMGLWRGPVMERHRLGLFVAIRLKRDGVTIALMIGSRRNKELC